MISFNLPSRDFSPFIYNFMSENSKFPQFSRGWKNKPPGAYWRIYGISVSWDLAEITMSIEPLGLEPLKRKLQFAKSDLLSPQYSKPPTNFGVDFESSTKPRRRQDDETLFTTVWLTVSDKLRTCCSYRCSRTACGGGGPTSPTTPIDTSSASTDERHRKPIRNFHIGTNHTKATLA